MKGKPNHIASFLALIFALFTLPQSVLAQTLPNGGSLTASLGDGSTVDTYTFSGVAGETIAITMVDTGDGTTSNIYPLLELYRPNGQYQAQAFGPEVASFSDTTLPFDGTYTVIAKDRFNSPAGPANYEIHFAKANGANEGGILPNGDEVNGNLSIGDLDSYTFNATSGDTVSLKLAYAGSNLPVRNYPQLFIYRPDGLRVGTHQAQYVTSIIDTFIAVTGTYTVIVRNRHTFAEGFGDYNLNFVKVAGANDSGILTNNQTKNNNLTSGDLDTYLFYAHFGDRVTLTMTDTSGSNQLSPALSLYYPHGLRLAFDLGPDQAEILNTSVQETGWHTVMAYNRTGFDTGVGNYSLNYLCTGNCTSPTPACNGLPVDVDISNGDVPTSSADVILGTSGADTINGLGGNDTICGLSGNDIINAGGGDDWVDGGTGDDDIQGSAGNDDLFGGNGNDVIRGGSGDDDINGEDGDDTLIGQPGDDAIDGGDGIDDINGGGGNDTIYTGSGATVGSGVFVSGSGGDDTIHGGPDADDIKGSTGTDTINGEGGNDVITGGNGRDTIHGGDGDDNIKGQESRDTIFGGAGNDILSGGSGNDTMNGGDGDDSIIGGPDDDVLRGDSGADDIKGGSGDDTLVGGPSTGDFCNGQTGTDTAVPSCETISGVP